MNSKWTHVIEPGASVVVGHEVPERQCLETISAKGVHRYPETTYLVHLSDVQELVVGRTSGNGSLYFCETRFMGINVEMADAESVGHSVALLRGILIDSSAEVGNQVGEALALGRVGGVLVINIEAVETVVLDKLQRGADEGRALAGVGDEVEVARLRVCPSADGQRDLQIPG